MIKLLKGKKIPVSKLDDLFRSAYFLDDCSQRVMLKYIYETQLMLNKVIRQYDIGGNAYVIPSLDLGFTYNTGRLAGGFTTGMMVNWNCRVPFVPIDMTIKECAGSLAYIETNEKFDKFFTVERINESLLNLRKEGFQFSFRSGNHFINLYKNTNGKYVLAIHSGDDSYRNEIDGVYPSDKVWYHDMIKTVYNSDRTRFLNYLVDKEAKKFVQSAFSKKNNVRQMHILLSEKIILGYGKLCESRTYQHYGFDSENTVLLGTGLVSPENDFPIFSDNGLPFVIVTPSENMWSLDVDGERKYLIPHGWGQEIENISGVKYSIETNELTLNFIKNKTLVYQSGYEFKFPQNTAKIRHLNNYAEFIEGKIPYEKCWNGNLFVNVKEILYPCASYDVKSSRIILWEK